MTIKINADNIFSINRIGFDETIESGTSFTVGLDYENIKKKDDRNF